MPALSMLGSSFATRLATLLWRDPACRQVGELAQFDSELQQLMDASQRWFLDIGNTLQQFVAAGSKLGAVAERLTGLISNGAETSTAVDDTVALIKRAFLVVRQCRQRTAEITGQLVACEGELDALHKDEDHLARVLGPLRTIQTLFKIEAATLPPEIQSIFNSVTVEIARLDSQVGEIFGRQSVEMDRRYAAISGAVSRLRDDATRRQEQIDTQERDIAALVEAAQRQFESAREHDEQIAARLRDIDQAGSQIITNVQFQDITRQRLEHVQTSLREMQERGLQGSRNAQTRSWLARVSQLESRQIGDVESELCTAASSVSKGMDDVLAQLAAFKGMDQGSRRAHGAGSTNEVVRVLLTHATAVGRLASEALLETETAVEAVEAFGDLSATLSGTMHRLARDIRLIGLNAQIQAVQAGSPGLETLSSITYGISAETSRLAVNINAALQRTTERLRELATLGHQVRTQVAEQRTQLDLESRASCQRLSAFGETISALFAEMESSLDTVGTIARSDRRKHSIDALPLHTLQALRVHLEELHKTCAKRGHCATQHIDEGMGSMQARYTMESERRIHAATLTATTQPKPEPRKDIEAAALIAGSQPQDTLGDNVELF